MVWLLNSQGINNCKSAESFCLDILFTQIIGLLKFWHIYCCHVYLFSVRYLNMCKPRAIFFLLWGTGPPALAFYGSGPACLSSWLGMNASWLGSMKSEFFSQMKFNIFQGCPTKLGAFLPGQPAPYNQFFIQQVFFVP